MAMVKKFLSRWYPASGTFSGIQKFGGEEVDYVLKNLMDTKLKNSASMLIVMYCILSQVISCSSPRVASFL